MCDMVEGDYTECEFKRTSCKFDDLSKVFRSSARLFELQYAALYRCRYEKCLPLLRASVDEKWGSHNYSIQEVCSLGCGSRAIVMGTLFKSMLKQPSILKEISDDVADEDFGLNQFCDDIANKENFTSDDDYLILEDLRQRIAIRTCQLLDPHQVVTGVPIALLGQIDEEDARFIVEDYCFIGIRNQIRLSCLPSKDKFIVFISGLELCSSNDLLPFHMFVDFMAGHIGDNENVERTANVCRVVICGNSIAAHSFSGADSSKFSLRKDVPDNAPWVDILDAYLAELANTVPVDIMPGSLDPTNAMLPQQPLHHCLFPRCGKNSNLHAVTNPYWFEVDGLRILGTSGQNVTDILRYSRLNGPLDALEKIINWSHLTPTAPDTLPTIPHKDDDPFVLSETPHVIFAGNQREFAFKKFEGASGKSVSLVSVPVFSESSTCVWLNLRNLEAFKMTFSADNIKN